MFSVDHPPTPGSRNADKIIIILFLIDPHCRVLRGGEDQGAVVSQLWSNGTTFWDCSLIFTN